MKEDSARTLLNRIMGWDTLQINKERPDLQALAAIGYDDYQQFSPGMRFVERLSLWLRQFPTTQRKVAYDFMKNRLLYISRPQMEHLVSISYPDFIQPLLLKQVSEESYIDIPVWKVKKLTESSEFTILLHQTLFLGLSDGSYIDVFRRNNTGIISHEQIFRTHEITKTRAVKMIKELEKSLANFKEKKPVNKFRNIFLLDDFSASGISYLKEDDSKINKVKGKIANFYDSIIENSVFDLVNATDLRVHVILYIATEEAIHNLQKLGTKIFKTIAFSVDAIMTLPNSICFNETSETEFLNLIKNYGCDNLLNEHFEQGRKNKLYLGFNEGGLPLILHHNTPNNSLPILWNNEDPSNFKGLFPRVSRHQ